MNNKQKKYWILSQFYDIMEDLEHLLIMDCGVASDALFTMIDELQQLSQQSWVRSNASGVTSRETP